MNVNSHKSLHLTQNAKDEFALFENDITRFYWTWYVHFYSRYQRL